MISQRHGAWTFPKRSNTDVGRFCRAHLEQRRGDRSLRHRTTAAQLAIRVRLVSWNVNSIRSRVEGIGVWLDIHQPDVVLVQETRCTDADFPFDLFSERGFEIAHHSVNHWNGVAVASRIGLADVHRGFEDQLKPPFDEPRLISATVGDVRVHSVYVPNGRSLDDPYYEFKLAWLEQLRRQLASDIASGVSTIVGGDFNVAPADIDLYDPKRWHNKKHASPRERAAIAALIDIGLVDAMRAADPTAGVYTWWNYRPGQFEANKGLRIDHWLATPNIIDRVDKCWVALDARADARPSDHAPIVFDLCD
jgi:exodeoxyribonuclease III